MTENYFCVRHKIRQKHNQYFNTAIFQTKFTLWQIKLIIYIEEIKFNSHEYHLFGCFYSSNEKENHTD